MRRDRAGQDNEEGGRARGLWLDQAHALARAGLIDGIAMAPISGAAMKMADMADRLVGRPDDEFLTLLAGELRVVRVTDHVPLAEVSPIPDPRCIERAIQTAAETFALWGFASPRIGVCGFNPHAVGAEERDKIAPAIAAARKKGIDAQGPLSPDTAFRQCIEGRYHLVIAMYHDQGHIAVKTLGRRENYALNIGYLPYPLIGTPHGTAFDIVGKGSPIQR